ncbi:MAG TPA: transporter substrate-binding domain-containing protein [Acetobacteraceae bacterium]|nr:transporter substrate-binding domain-containing protein [Acetobacteraceae bacterium]
MDLTQPFPRRTLLGAASGLMLAAGEPPTGPAIALRTNLGIWTDDFDGLLKRRVIRMLVPYGRTLFFQDRGTLYGVTVNAAQLLESWLNVTFKTGRRPLVVALLPTSRDHLLDELLAGRGDVAAGDISITPERAVRVAFTTPLLRDVREIVVTRTDAPALADADALSGMQVAVQEGTSFQQSLAALNQRLKTAGKPEVRVETVPGTLESEDMMEMVGAGLLPAMVADDWIARLWTTLVPNLRIQDKAVLRSGVDIAWAVRPGNPKLLAVLNEAITKIGGDAQKIANRTAFYMRKLKRIHDATAGTDVKRFEVLRALFLKYGNEYGFDDLLLQAQSYQESRLRQDARSHVGAIGLMQLMPPTGAAMQVGNIHQAEPNVHAGAKYMRRLVDRYFPDAKFDRQNRTLFAFAAYNAGPAAIARMRRLAAQQGLDPNRWFDNVERVTAAHIGQEPVRYVRNIYKYYIAYSLLEQQQAEVEQARKAAVPSH